MRQSVQSLVEEHLPNLLRAIRNHPPGREHGFLWSRQGGLGGIGLRWWVADDQPFYDFALAVADQVPDFLDRYTVDEAAAIFIDVIRQNLHDFNLNPFFLPSSLHTNLIECASPVALSRVANALLVLVSEPDHALFLFPVRLLRPAADVIGHSFVWLRHSAPTQLVESLVRIDYPGLTFETLPPLRENGINIGAEDSLLGAVAHGWQAAEAMLRRVAGALCLSLSYKDATFKSMATPSTATAAFFEDGRIEIRFPGPFLPPLTGSTVLPVEATEQVTSNLSPRKTPDRDNRFRIALEFLALGWILGGTLSFMNFFIALDALFGEPYKSRPLIEENVKQRLAGIDWKPGDRIGLLINIRNDLFHGSSSSLTTSKHYLAYRKEFRDDPLKDIFRIIRECLLREPMADSASSN